MGDASDAFLSEDEIDALLGHPSGEAPEYEETFESLEDAPGLDDYVPSDEVVVLHPRFAFAPEEEQLRLLRCLCVRCGADAAALCHTLEERGALTVEQCRILARKLRRKATIAAPDRAPPERASLLRALLHIYCEAEMLIRREEEAIYEALGRPPCGITPTRRTGGSPQIAHPMLQSLLTRGQDFAETVRKSVATSAGDALPEFRMDHADVVLWSDFLRAVPRNSCAVAMYDEYDRLRLVVQASEPAVFAFSGESVDPAQTETLLERLGAAIASAAVERESWMGTLRPVCFSAKRRFPRRLLEKRDAATLLIFSIDSDERYGSLMHALIPFDEEQAIASPGRVAKRRRSPDPALAGHRLHAHLLFLNQPGREISDIQSIARRAWLFERSAPRRLAYPAIIVGDAGRIFECSSVERLRQRDILEYLYGFPEARGLRPALEWSRKIDLGELLEGARDAGDSDALQRWLQQAFEPGAQDLPETQIKPALTGRLLLTLPLHDARSFLERAHPRDAALALQVASDVLLSSENLFLGAGLIRNLPVPDLLSQFLSVFVNELPYQREQAILHALEEIDPELKEELAKHLPTPEDMFFLTHPARDRLLQSMPEETLRLLARELVREGRSGRATSNGFRNVRVLFQEALGKEEALRIVPRRRQIQPLTAGERETLMRAYRAALAEISAHMSTVFWQMGGGHPDPGIAVYSYLALVQRSGEAYVGRAPDFPGLEAHASDRRRALKAIGDAVAAELKRRIETGEAFPELDTGVASLGIAVGEDFAENYWHYDLEQTPDV